jgi:CheY-like chemotaxis protein
MDTTAVAVMDTVFASTSESTISVILSLLISLLAFLKTLLFEVIKNPGILWVIFASIILWRFYKPLRYELLPNLSGFKVMGVEFSFVQASITHAIELAEKSKEFPRPAITDEEQQRVINRARKNTGLFRGTHILWIDDFPDSPVNERMMLKSLRVTVDMAQNTAEAEKMLRAKDKKYDLILSDMKRGDDGQAGLKFLQTYAKQKERVPVIFYIGFPDPKKGVPPQAFGITHRPDELLHLIMDALERVKS